MQTIWITGGSTGIGFAVAKKFLEENWRVIISSRNEEKLNKAVEKLKKQTNKKEIFYKACGVIFPLIISYIGLSELCRSQPNSGFPNFSA